MLSALRAALFAFVFFVVSVPVSAAEKLLPIVFVHGNGDSAAVWTTTIWRFESNGYPSELLDAVDLPYPLASAVWDQKQPGRSTAEEAMRALAAEIAAVKKRTGAAKVVLVGQSRGGTIVRNYLKNGGGAASTAIAVLCGAPDHGVVVSDTVLAGSEFNGASDFLRDLNSTPDEIVPGVRFMTIRSDGNDKYAQPDGRFIGHPGLATGIGFDAPELTGATDVVIPHLDHRETGFSAEAFAAMYKFITGHPPRITGVRREKYVALDGKVSGYAEGAPTNIGVPGATIEVYKVSQRTGERIGNAMVRKVTEEDGRWGPLKIDSNAYLEFVVAVPGFPVTHVYRSPFLRSTRLIELRPQLLAKDDRDTGAVVYVSRPRGYFGVGRDHLTLDGKLPPGIADGVPSVSSAKLAFAREPQPVLAVFNRERILLRTWPLRDSQVSVAEFTW
jgi:pimeloyl-ACP methyl ester carboxylesterase